MFKHCCLLITTLVLVLTSCKDDSDARFTKLSSSQTGIDFKNLVRESEEFNVLTFGYFYNGGGVAVGDINNDGLPDIYFTGNMMASHLYLNEGDLQFKEIAESAGVKAEGLWNTGVTMVDVNADGWLDIYVCRSAANLGVRRTNQLFINNRNLTFTESASTYGLDDQGYSTQAAFLDYDRDGDLDMFLLNHSVQEYAGFGRNLPELKNQRNKEYGDRLYENNLFFGQGQMIGRFNDVTAKSGINSTVLGFGLGVSVEDLNNDGWVDIYVSNDYNEEDYLYINQQDGTFKNEVVSMLDQSSLFSMGNDIADINNDGYPDIITLDMLPEDHQRIQMTSGSDNYTKKQMLYQSGFHKQSMRNMLHLNNGDGTFSELGQLAGISNTDWSWASLVEDYDLDGDSDIFVTNGYKSDYTNMDFMSYAADQQVKSQTENASINISSLIENIPSIETSNYIFRNEGNIKFDDVSEEWGIEEASLSNGAAYADFDGDGDLDLVVNNVNALASVYRNNTKENKGVRIKLTGRPSNPFAIGASVKLFDNDRTLAVKRLSLARGFQSSVEPIIIFADTLMRQTNKIVVDWPGGGSQIETKLDGVESIDIKYDESKIVTSSNQGSQDGQVYVKKSSDRLAFMHTDSDYNDFNFQRLMPFKMSDRGAKVTMGDLNTDGHMDMYICGAQGSAGSLFFQREDGSYKEMENIDFAEHKMLEEMDAQFFDMDRDSDLDLVVVYSSYESEPDKPNVAYAIFSNDGKGNFKLHNSGASDVNNSFSTVSVSDIDGDGDQDIFLGSYLLAKSYPNTSESKILLNNGNGVFEEHAEQWLKNQVHDQILTDSKFYDVDQDGDEDLILAGHWMPITICTNDGEEFTCDAIENSDGWWNTIEIADLNNDGFGEIVGGNYGLNSQLEASSLAPLHLYYDDFDQNGTIDPLLCKSNNGKLYPLAFRDDLIAQLPGLKKSFNSYSEYANASLGDILSQEVIANANPKMIKTLASSIFSNSGNGKFSLMEMPWQAQLSPVYAILIADVDDDGNPDLLLGGNQEGAMEQLGPNMANKLSFLLGDGKGIFKSRGSVSGALGITGEIRDIKLINNDSYLVSLRNDSLLILNIEL